MHCASIQAVRVTHGGLRIAANRPLIGCTAPASCPAVIARPCTGLPLSPLVSFQKNIWRGPHRRRSTADRVSPPPVRRFRRWAALIRQGSARTRPRGHVGASAARPDPGGRGGWLTGTAYVFSPPDAYARVVGALPARGEPSAVRGAPSLLPPPPPPPHSAQGSARTPPRRVYTPPPQPSGPRARCLCGAHSRSLAALFPVRWIERGLAGCWRPVAYLCMERSPFLPLILGLPPPSVRAVFHCSGWG